MFTEMRKNPEFDPNKPLLWGYFFADPEPLRLEKAGERLQNDGYRVVTIYETDDQTTYFLHVEKVERHDSETLHQRNQELDALAEELGLESYDGMDVGPVSQ
jgi:hypothetical protein